MVEESLENILLEVEEEFEVSFSDNDVSFLAEGVRDYIENGDDGKFSLYLPHVAPNEEIEDYIREEVSDVFGYNKLN